MNDKLLNEAIHQAERQKERDIRCWSVSWDCVPKLEAERDLWRRRADTCEDKWQELFDQRAALVEEVKRLRGELASKQPKPIEERNRPFRELVWDEEGGIRHLFVEFEDGTLSLATPQDLADMGLPTKVTAE